MCIYITKNNNLLIKCSIQRKAIKEEKRIDRKLNANVRILNFKLSPMMTEIILPEIKCLKCFHYRSKGFELNQNMSQQHTEFLYKL